MNRFRLIDQIKFHQFQLSKFHKFQSVPINRRLVGAARRVRKAVWIEELW
jgi:hypothetical protein